MTRKVEDETEVTLDRKKRGRGMSVLTRGLNMDLTEKSSAVKETVEHRLTWGWESAF